VVKDGGATGRFSALPHAVLFSGLSDGAVRMYATIQSHAWGDGGECTASHATLAAEMGRKERTVRALLRELVDAGFVVERRTGHGQAKAYRTACPDPSGKNLPVESGNILPVVPPKRQKSATQAAKNGQFKRQKSAAPIEEDSGKKTLEEELQPTAVDVDADAAVATAADHATVLCALSADARVVIDWHRQCHGSKRPVKLNPTQARQLEEALADLGVERLRESVEYMAGQGVRELSKAIRAARTKRQRDESGPSAQPRSNGSAGSNNRAAPASAAPAGTSSSKWDGWKGRHGMTVSRAAGYEDDR
jgi:hypothetical protein